MFLLINNKSIHLICQKMHFLLSIESNVMHASASLLSRTMAVNPYPESEPASHLKELWHALSQKRRAVMSAMKKSCLGKYTIVGDVNM
jgi:hypothetical protein